MKISQLMAREVTAASPEDTLEYASQVMAHDDIDTLPICENKQLIGMLSNSDIALLTAANPAVKHTKLRYLMTCEARYVFEDQSVAYASHYMREHNVRRLLVLNRDNRLVGAVSMSDLPWIENSHIVSEYSGVCQPC